MAKLDPRTIIKILETWFTAHGKPMRIRSDGGPQFRQEFESWCRTEDIIHELASPYNPQSNGHAEKAIGEMKKLLEKTETKDFGKALLEYRNTPRIDGLSPAQWYLGRRQRTNVVVNPKVYEHSGL